MRERRRGNVRLGARLRCKSTLRISGSFFLSRVCALARARLLSRPAPLFFLSPLSLCLPLSLRSLPISRPPASSSTWSSVIQTRSSALRAMRRRGAAGAILTGTAAASDAAARATAPASSSALRAMAERGLRERREAEREEGKESEARTGRGGRVMPTGNDVFSSTVPARPTAHGRPPCPGSPPHAVLMLADAVYCKSSVSFSVSCHVPRIEDIAPLSCMRCACCTGVCIAPASR